MNRSMHVLAVAVTVWLLAAPAATADPTYRTTQADLRPTTKDAPLRSGFVVNIHANGPENYAHERYVLNGAAPDTAYEVTLLVSLGDPTCTGEPIAIPSVSFETNGAGNGEGRLDLRPEDIPPPARGHTHGVIWLVADETGPRYETECTPVTLD